MALIRLHAVDPSDSRSTSSKRGPMGLRAYPRASGRSKGAGERYLPAERQALGAERFAQTHALPLSTLLDDIGFEPGVTSGGR